ncbi:restriction endonuclease [Krasilnikovia sp. MM14-A1259]|uniref:restriction endonuclease n=1 Tax=Krasilnikovia sp. MM14-A1259 TaxID=3373539 RepID=UPI003814BD82
MPKKRRRNKSNATATALGIGLLALAAIAQLVHDHPYIFTSIALVALLGPSAWVYKRWRAMRKLAAYERHVSVVDGMSGSEFEQFVARLMRASGYRGVTVQGGAGDMGADVVGRSPCGRRVVVQCKRYAGSLGSPHVQRFAGTAREIHGADVALLVTSGSPTGPAREVARRCRIVLVDRPALAQWMNTHVLPLDHAL